MKNFKRTLAVVMTVAMTLGSAVTVFGSTTNNAGTSAEGEGQLTEYINRNISEVRVPTDASTDVLDFVLDPQDLIKEVIKSGDFKTGWDYANLSESDIKNSTGLYFKNMTVSDNATVLKELSDTSDPIVLRNEGWGAANISVTAELEEAAGLDAVDNTVDFQDGKPQIYLGLIGGTGSETALKTSGSKVIATVSGQISGNDWSKAHFAYTASGNYAATITVSDNEKPKFEIKMKGAINNAKEADWSALKGKTPKVKITWTISDVVSSSTATTAYAMVYNNTIYLKKSSSENFATGATVANVTVNGTTASGAKLNSAGAVEVGATSSFTASGGKYVVNATVGGVAYTATMNAPE